MTRGEWEDALITEAANTAGPAFVPALGYRRSDLVAVANLLVLERTETARWASLTPDQQRQEKSARAQRMRDFALAEARDYPHAWDNDLDRRRHCLTAHNEYSEAVADLLD